MSYENYTKVMSRTDDEHTHYTERRLISECGGIGWAMNETDNAIHDGRLALMALKSQQPPDVEAIRAKKAEIATAHHIAHVLASRLTCSKEDYEVDRWRVRRGASSITSSYPPGRNHI